MMTATAAPAWAPEQPWANPGGRIICSADAPREEWLAARRNMICASDLGALYGVSRYGDQHTLWLDKRGAGPAFDGNTATRRGQIFEGPVIDLWAEQYAEFPIMVRRAGLIQSRNYEHAGATVDRLSVCPLGRCTVEAKTQINMTEWTDGDEDEVPTAYQFQGQWQLYCTGRDHVHYVVMGPGFRPLHRIQYRDDALILTMVERARAWWERHINGGVMPEPTHLAASAIKQMYGNPPPGEVFYLDDDEAVNLWRSLPLLKADAEAAKAAYEDVLAQLQARVGNATAVRWPGEDEDVATWKPGKTVDGADAGWRKAHADLIAPYLVPTTELDVAALVRDHPDLIGAGGLRRRRTWKPCA